MKILLIDIETTPSLSYHWGMFNQNLSLAHLVKAGELLCFAAKFVGEKKVHFHSAWGKTDMVLEAHALLTEADIVVGYNSDGFDLKHLNAEFAKAGLGPPAPYQTIDLYKTVKKNFRFISNKLENVLRELSLEQKVKHRGFSLWPACMNGDPQAQREMKKYCIGDVIPLEEGYVILRPWVPNHPNVNLYKTDKDLPDGCPTCGSYDYQSRGKRRTNVSVYQRFHCQNCGRWFSSGKREIGASLR